MSVEWASGLFVGEGNIGKIVSKTASGNFNYLSIQLGMYDERAVSKFASVFEIPYHKFLLKKQNHLFYKIHIRGRKAEKILSLM